jgi:ornithine cyclodeaminase
MVLFSATTGLVEAVLLDNGYLTDVRTAAAGAIAAKWLARADARSAGIIGAGVQGRLQLEALTLVRKIEQAAVWARDPAKAERFADEMSARLDLPVRATASAESLVRASDIVVTTTPSTEPLVMAQWLRAGQHITAMGSDAEHKNELAPAVLGRAELYVCDRQSQCAKLGELHHALASGVLGPGQRFPELGQIIAGTTPGRIAAAQVTVCDLTGTGVQDTAIATFARQRAAAAGAGSLMTA